MDHGGAGDFKVNYDLHPAYDSPTVVGVIDTRDLEMLSEQYDRLIAGATGDTATNGFLGALREFWSGLGGQYPEGPARDFVTHLGVRVEELLLHQAQYMRIEQYVPMEHGRALTDDDAQLKEFRERRRLFGRLSKSTLKKAEKAAAVDALKFRMSANDGKLHREDLSTNGGPSVRRIVAALNREFRRNGVFRVLEACYGRKFCVLGLSLELSDARSTWWRHSLKGFAAPRTLYAHLDESIEYPKAILYLTDVTSTSGPTSVYPMLWDQMQLNPIVDATGRVVSNFWRAYPTLADYLDDVPYHQTFASAKFRSLFMSLPRELRFNSHLGWDVIPGSELEQTMVQREEFLLGPSGTYVVFDGARLFHRGGLIERGDRIACQVIFGPHSERVFVRRAWNRARRDLARVLRAQLP